jgi:tetratricopeptide (TPR) repeat protein
VLGRCLADRRANAEAIEEFRYVLSIDPQNLVALRSLGEIALDQDQTGDAAHWFRELISVDPMNEDARRALEQLGASAQPDVSMATAPAGSWLETMDEEMNGLHRPPASEPVFDLEEPVQHAPPSAEPGDLEIEDFASLGDSETEPATGHFAFSDDDSDADLREDDEEDAPGELVTETIAELYARQGFYDRSAEVLRELIRRRGGDEALSRRLEEIERLAAGGQSGPGRHEHVLDEPFDRGPAEHDASEFDDFRSDSDRPDAAFLPDEEAAGTAPSHEPARDFHIDGLEGFDRVEAPAEAVTFEPASFGERDVEVAPDATFELEHAPDAQAGPEQEQEQEQEQELTRSFELPGSEQPFEPEASEADGVPMLEPELSREPALSQEQVQEHHEAGFSDPEDAFAASFTHGFHTQQDEGVDSPVADAAAPGQRPGDGEDTLEAAADTPHAFASDFEHAGDEWTAEREPAETIAGYLGGLASWRPGAAAEQSSPAVVAAVPADGFDVGSGFDSGYGVADTDEPSLPADPLHEAASVEETTSSVSQDQPWGWDPEESFGAPTPEAPDEAGQPDGRDDFDLEFPSAELPQNGAAGHEGTVSAAADHFPWEEEGAKEPPRPTSEQHRGEDDASGGTAEPGSFEEYLSFDGDTLAESVPDAPVDQGILPATPRAPDASAEPSGAKDDDDDLESFQTWLRSLKR